MDLSPFLKMNYLFLNLIKYIKNQRNEQILCLFKKAVDETISKALIVLYELLWLRVHARI